MAKCEHCGRELADGEVCGCTGQNGQPVDYSKYFQVTISKDALSNMKGTLGSIRENLSDTADAALGSGAGGPYERNMQIVDECVVPTEEEIPIRQYNIARLRTPLWKKAFGRLQVTNKRVLFRAKGKSLAGPIEIENEFSLEEIGGVEIKMDYRFNLLIFILSTLAISFCLGVYVLLEQAVLGTALRNGSIAAPTVLAIVTTVLALAVLLLAPGKVWKAVTALCSALAWTLEMAVTDFKLWAFVAFVFGVIGIVMWILSALIDDLHILLKIKGAHGAIEIGRKLRKDERSGFSVVQPWKDTEIAIRELGALIDDVKRFGNAGIEKWKI